MYPVPRKLHIDAIAAAHRKAEARGQEFLEAVIEVGKRLVDARSECDYGQWGDWIDQNLPFDQRQAQKYIRVFEKQSDVLKMRIPNSHLSLDNILKGLAKPRRKKVTNVRNENVSEAEAEEEEAAEEAAPAPEPVYDGEGRQIAPACKQFDGIVAAMSERENFKVMMSAVSKIKKEAVELSKNTPAWRYLVSSQWEADCSNLRSSLRFAMPHAICPWCHGNGCETCKGLGWVSEGLWKAAPKELKE